jgi:hypothetical protein
MNNETQNSQNNEEESTQTTDKTFAKQVKESVDFVVDMMNNGNINPKDVYPPGRYHGD